MKLNSICLLLLAITLVNIKHLFISVEYFAIFNFVFLFFFFSKFIEIFFPSCNTIV